MSETKSVRRRVLARLLMGIAIGVCIAAGTAGLAFRQRADPSWKRIHDDLATLNAALEKYHTDHGSWPEGDTLDALVPGYLPALPVDPWGRPYVYENNGRRPLILTFGKDGERGGYGDEQDHHQYDGHIR
jgi:general secretion pathway protein G